MTKFVVYWTVEDMKTLDKVVLVTGGSSGIGAAICKLLAQNGMTVYTVSRSGALPQESQESDNIRACSADVNDPDALAAVVELILKEHGRLDAVVCNAGNGIAGSVEETSNDEIRYQMGTTFMGTINTIKACMPVFRSQKEGRVITISSVAALVPLPFQGYYSCAKAGILQMTKALALEAKEFGVQTCCILPGDVKTGFTRARKIAGAAVRKESPYFEACQRAVEAMAKDEQVDGMQPEVIAGAVLAQLRCRRMSPEKVPSLKYKVLVALIRILPERLVMYILGLMYS